MKIVILWCTFKSFKNLTLLQGLKTFVTYVLLCSLDCKPHEERPTLYPVNHLVYSYLYKYHITFIRIVRFQNCLKSLNYMKKNFTRCLNRSFCIFSHYSSHELEIFLLCKFAKCLLCIKYHWHNDIKYKNQNL